MLAHIASLRSALASPLQEGGGGGNIGGGGNRSSNFLPFPPGGVSEAWFTMAGYS